MNTTSIHESFKTLSIAFLSLLSVATITLNVISLVVIKKSKKMLTRPSIHFIINLLIVDLLQGIFVIPIYAVKKQSTHSRFWDSFVCNSFRFLYMLTYYMSIFCVLLIASDRYIATTFVFKYKSLVRVKTVRIVIIISWIYITMLCIIPFSTSELPRRQSFELPTQLSTKIRLQQLSELPLHPSPKLTLKSSTELPLESSPEQPLQLLPDRINQQNDFCIYRQNTAWTITMLVFNCFFPYLIILYFYKCIIKNIQEFKKESVRIKNIQESTETSQQNVLQYESQTGVYFALNFNKQISSHTKNIIKISVLISVCYAICWTPSVIYYVLSKFCPKKCFYKNFINSASQTYLEFAIKYLGFLNSISAPIIYCYTDKEFCFQLKSLSLSLVKEKRIF
ncbi:beta-2 adrenergic receptor-like [Hydra vulgaris]|uniref:Beta-2 adrenergic receptor-like n=1 Tax=Hydra vulgaris TaxID=6087 RepID=A0ABM4DAQ8_HYDVU